jgi:dolichol-phosphate mannosyltransferase
MKLLTIVVNFNQVHEIKSALTGLLEHVAIENIVVVDDGSTDGSAEIAQAMKIPMIRHEANQGIGAAIRSGIFYAKENGFQAVVIFSSNGKMSPTQMRRVCGPVLAGTADYVQGSRFAKNGESLKLPLLRWILIRLFSLFATAILRRRFTDITCGYRAYRIDWLFEGDVHLGQPWLDRYEMEYYIHYKACRHGLRIQEVPVTIRYSHLSTGRHSKIKLSRSAWSIIRPMVLLPLGLKH